MKQYGLISNIIFIYKNLFQFEKKTKILLPVFIISQILLVSVPVLIPARAVYVIEHKLGITDFFYEVGALILFYGILLLVHQVSEQFYQHYIVIFRTYGFMGKLIEKSMTGDYCNWESNKNQKQIGKAAMAIGGNAFGIERVYRELPNAIIHFIGMIVFGGAILTVDIRILFILVFMLLCNLYFNQFARNYMNSVMEENTEISRKMGIIERSALEPTFGKDARIYRMESWLHRILFDYRDQGCAWQKRVEKRWYLPAASDTIFIALRDGFAYILFIRMAFRGEISLSELTLMLGIVARFSDWIFGFVNACMEIKTADKLIVEFRKTLDMPDSFHHKEISLDQMETGDTIKKKKRKKIQTSINKNITIPKIQLKFAPEIELKDVSFCYGEEEQEILSDINLHIHSGERIAIVGANGAGKTTLVKLLCGFYHPTKGEIFVNHRLIEDYIIEDYFKMVGVVFQDMDILSISIVSIVSGKEKKETDMKRFWEAVEQAGIRKKIESLEQKEDTYLGLTFDEHGIQLSGGETQKLMLARCIYKNAPFLILDEPTSALDPIAESAIYEEYHDLTEKKTSIFISHRLASTKFCDRILFLENGKIIEEGSHQELLDKKGRYAEIYHIQSHYYKEEKKGEESI